ncbi:hypothetical protein BGX26_009762 [Mortierella sp. AD094]|nr:hypothetical protein BGX26_009762 [Mortierella sp. AD094]
MLKAPKAGKSKKPSDGPTLTQVDWDNPRCEESTELLDITALIKNCRGREKQIIFFWDRLWPLHNGGNGSAKSASNRGSSKQIPCSGYVYMSRKGNIDRKAEKVVFGRMYSLRLLLNIYLLEAIADKDDNSASQGPHKRHQDDAVQDAVHKVQKLNDADAITDKDDSAAGQRPHKRHQDDAVQDAAHKVQKLDDALGAGTAKSFAVNEGSKGVQDNGAQINAASHSKQTSRKRERRLRKNLKAKVAQDGLSKPEHVLNNCQSLQDIDIARAYHRQASPVLREFEKSKPRIKDLRNQRIRTQRSWKKLAASERSYIRDYSHQQQTMLAQLQDSANDDEEATTTTNLEHEGQQGNKFILYTIEHYDIDCIKS